MTISTTNKYSQFFKPGFSPFTKKCREANLITSKPTLFGPNSNWMKLKQKILRIQRKSLFCEISFSSSRGRRTFCSRRSPPPLRQVRLVIFHPLILHSHSILFVSILFINFLFCRYDKNIGSLYESTIFPFLLCISFIQGVSDDKFNFFISLDVFILWMSCLQGASGGQG